jgi:hypothetical protein
MATDEDRESTEQESDEMEANLSEAGQSGEGKGAGVTPGHAGQAHTGDRPADAGQTPPA